MYSEGVLVGLSPVKVITVMPWLTPRGVHSSTLFFWRGINQKWSYSRGELVFYFQLQLFTFDEEKSFDQTAAELGFLAEKRELWCTRWAPWGVRVKELFFDVGADRASWSRGGGGGVNHGNALSSIGSSPTKYFYGKTFSRQKPRSTVSWKNPGKVWARNLAPNRPAIGRTVLYNYRLGEIARTFAGFSHEHGTSRLSSRKRPSMHHRRTQDTFLRSNLSYWLIQACIRGVHVSTHPSDDIFLCHGGALSCRGFRIPTGSNHSGLFQILHKKKKKTEKKWTQEVIKQKSLVGQGIDIVMVVVNWSCLPHTLLAPQLTGTRL